VTVDAACFTQFSWMENSISQSPCYVAALLLGSCQSGSWHIPALGPNQQYGAPGPTNSTYCDCSWAVYNLLSACTACQGMDSIENWSPYSESCGTFATNTYFPTDKIIVPNNTLLPSWAAINPTTWLGARFDVDQAQSIHNQGKPDINLSPTSTSHKRSSNAGPIAGGVIGGLAAVAILAAIFVIARRRRRRRARGRTLVDPMPNLPPQIIHGRSLSDSSQDTTKMGYTTTHMPEIRHMGSSPSISVSNGSANGSVVRNATVTSNNSLPYDLSIIGGPASASPSPPPPQPLMPSLSVAVAPTPAIPNLENVIDPYTAVPSPDAVSEKRRIDGTTPLRPIYENEDGHQVGPSNQTSASRRRFNPPTYNESVASGESIVMRNLPPAGAADPKRRGHGHQSSSDTVESSATMTTYGNRSSVAPRGGGRSASDNLPGFDDEIESVSAYSPRGSVLATGSSAISSPTHTYPRRHNIVSAVGSSVISGDDIA